MSIRHSFAQNHNQTLKFNPHFENLNMGKHVSSKVRAKIAALKDAKLTFPANCRQLQLKNPSTVRNIHDNFQRAGSLDSE